MLIAQGTDKGINSSLTKSSIKVSVIYHTFKRMKDTDKKLIVDLYHTKSIREICPIVGYCDKMVTKALKAEGIHIKGPGPYKRKGNVDENWFKEINSPEKAYFLGFLYADGNIYMKKHRVQILLHQQDEHILKLFASLVGHTGTLYTERGIHKRLTITSKQMCQDLIFHGCVPRKSLILEFPKTVSNELLPHFVRGFFDGDGSIYLGRNRTTNKMNPNARRISLTSTEKFLDSLSEVLISLGITPSKFTKRFKEQENSAGSIYFGSKDDVDRFARYIYNDCGNLFLTRKKIKFYANSTGS